MNTFWIVICLICGVSTVICGLFCIDMNRENDKVLRELRESIIRRNEKIICEWEKTICLNDRLTNEYRELLTLARDIVNFNGELINELKEKENAENREICDDVTGTMGDSDRGNAESDELVG